MLVDPWLFLFCENHGRSCSFFFIKNPGGRASPPSQIKRAKSLPTGYPVGVTAFELQRIMNDRQPRRLFTRVCGRRFCQITRSSQTDLRTSCALNSTLRKTAPFRLSHIRQRIDRRMKGQSTGSTPGGRVGAHKLSVSKSGT